MEGYSKVVGTTFIDNDLSKLVENAELAFIREKDNKFDKNAIKIFGKIDGKFEHIGYVKRELAENMANEIDSGTIIVGEISNITGGEDGKNIGINYKFYNYS